MTEKIISMVSDEVPMEVYKRCPFLEKDRERLGKLKILGKGQKGFVVESKKANSVIKVGIDEKSHISLANEARNHNLFLEKIAEGKFEKRIPEWINVPDIVDVIEPDQKNPFRYAIERINGETLKKIELIKSDTLQEYREKIKDFSDTEIYNMSEYQLNELLKLRGVEEEEILYTIIQPAIFILPSLFPEKTQSFLKCLEYLRNEKGIEHADLHTENLIVDKNGNLYLIDFGNINIYNTL